MIDFDQDRQAAIQSAERIHSRLQSTAIFAISSDSEPDLIIQAMRCGCSEYLTKPLGRDPMLEALARVGGRKKETREQYHAQVLSFIGAKGGVGVTTLATHFGAFLAKSFSRKTLMIDLHPDFGDAGLYLGLTQQEYDFYQLAENTERLDADFLQSFVSQHASGLDLLSAPESAESTGRHVAPEAISETLDFLRPRYEYIIVDCAPGLNRQNLEVVRRSDRINLVTVADVAAVRNAARYLDHLSRVENVAERVQVILNRHLKRPMISDEQIEKAIRRSIDWKVPNQYSQVIKTIYGGDPISQLSSSEVARALMGWAETLGKQAAPADEKRKSGKGFFGLLGPMTGALLNRGVSA
jgi:pilus assembly protein CpaE